MTFKPFTSIIKAGHLAKVFKTQKNTRTINDCQYFSLFIILNQSSMKKRNCHRVETILFDQDLYILWKDGHESRYDFYTLRCACPCAICIHELTGERILDPSQIPNNVSIIHCKYVGNYALNISWSDNHQTGLYTFRTLRRLCQCQLCKVQTS